MPCAFLALILKVVAEGVEEAEQLAWLKARGCAFYQGFLFGRPAPIEVIFDGDTSTVPDRWQAWLTGDRLCHPLRQDP